MILSKTLGNAAFRNVSHPLHMLVLNNGPERHKQLVVTISLLYDIIKTFCRKHGISYLPIWWIYSTSVKSEETYDEAVDSCHML
jgi:hypothetical protein